MEKSRPGAIQSWMLDMHSNVPQSFRNPAMKEMTQRTGILCTCMHSRLHRAIPKHRTAVWLLHLWQAEPYTFHNRPLHS